MLPHAKQIQLMFLHPCCNSETSETSRLEAIASRLEANTSETSVTFGIFGDLVTRDSGSGTEACLAHCLAHHDDVIRIQASIRMGVTKRDGMAPDRR